MNKQTEQRLKRLEGKVFENDKSDDKFVLIDIPGAKFWAEKKLKREDGKLKTINYKSAIVDNISQNGRLMTVEEDIAMRNYAHEQRIDLKDPATIADFYGIEDWDRNEWVFDAAHFAAFRGGYCYYGAAAGRFALYLSNDPAYRHCSIGFRCCRDVE